MVEDEPLPRVAEEAGCEAARAGSRDETGQATRRVRRRARAGCCSPRCSIWQLLLVDVDLQPGLQRRPHRQPRRRPRRRRRRRPARNGALARACASTRRSTMSGREGHRAGADPDRRPGPGLATTCAPRAARSSRARHGPQGPHRVRAPRRRRARRRRHLLPPAAARGGRPLRVRRALRAAAPRPAGARRRADGQPRGAGALDLRAHAADPPGDRRGDRPRRARAAARRPDRDRDHGQRRPTRSTSSATAACTRSDITFTDEAQLYQTIDRIVSQVNRRVDESSPMVDARLPTGERVNVIIPPLALQGPDADDPPLPAPVHARPARRDGLGRRARPSSCCARSCKAQAERRHLRRHGRRQDDAAQRAVGRRAGRRADHHRRGQRRAAPAAAARGHARGAPVQRRGARRDLDPRPRAQLAAHAARPDHRRRGPRRRDARHAPGAQHRPRGLAGHRPRQLLRRRDPPPRDARDDERPAHPVRGAARPDQLRDPRDRADRPLRRRRAPRSPRSPPSPPSAARRSGSARVARFETDPIGPDRRVTGRFRHFPLPPGIAEHLRLQGETVPARVRRRRPSRRAHARAGAPRPH